MTDNHKDSRRDSGSLLTENEIQQDKTTMYPLKFRPILKTVVWGGEKIAPFKGIETDQHNIGESWELSGVKGNESVVANGKFAGRTITSLIEEFRGELIGKKNYDRTGTEFPLLIKFIDARQDLSIQVHPDDALAAERHNGSKGKTEMWYVMDCDEDAKIICGIKESIKQEEIADITHKGKIREILNEVPIHKGDVIFIPSGTIHAILKGTLICEIQQNSNLTYRVYDWDRIGKDGKPRDLHIQKAIDVIKQDAKQKIVATSNQEVDISNNVISCNYFKVDTICIGSKYKQTSSKETFEAIMVVDGSGIIKTNGKEYKIKLGDSFIIPASLGEYEIEGIIILLKAYL